MKVANVGGRATVVQPGCRGIDVESASGARFGPDMQSVFDRWDDFRAWAESLSPDAESFAVDLTALSSPSPAPRQILAIGLNYDEHAAESGFGPVTGYPPTFTKFVSSLTGAACEVVLPEGGNTDWEVELVAVVGRQGRYISVSDAWDYVAGLSVGQDLSERVCQLEGPAPQFSLGKSFPNFSPIGPWLVTPDEVPNRDDLELGCSIDGEIVQRSRTSCMMFSVPELISRLSQVLTLFPGDVVFTGTPPGVGWGREPQRFLQPGEVLSSWIEGIGEITQRFVAPTT